MVTFGNDVKTTEEWFSVGDLIIARDFLDTKHRSFQARIFQSNSSWSPQEEVIPGTVALVLYASNKQTGAGRRWHKILVSLGGDQTKIGWIEGPGAWEKLDKRS